jgi:hypothetical protein
VLTRKRDGEAYYVSVWAMNRPTLYFRLFAGSPLSYGMRVRGVLLQRVNNGVLIHYLQWPALMGGLSP